MAERSEAKEREAKLRDKNILDCDIWREASLRVF